jgi:hypothetical protein
MTSKTNGPVFLLAVMCLLWAGAMTAQALHQRMIIGSSSRVTLPASASDVHIVISGAGGGAALYWEDYSTFCAAGGGSGASVSTNISRAPGYSLNVTIGQGGAPGTTLGGNGSPTILVIQDVAGNVLRTVTAYGGGGGEYVNKLTCLGGAGGGAASSALGATPGTGTPSGGYCQFHSGPEGNYHVPLEGAIVGEIKAGSAGGYAGADSTYPYSGANWSPAHSGGRSNYDYSTGCYCAGGAAGARSDGPAGACWLNNEFVEPRFNSGAGGATKTACPNNVTPGTAAGSDGFVTVEYTF